MIWQFDWPVREQISEARREQRIGLGEEEISEEDAAELDLRDEELTALRSERNPRGQDDVVVVASMHRHSDLLARAEGQADAVMNGDSAYYHPRR